MNYRYFINIKSFVISVLFVKICLMICFSSAYQNDLFLPFVKYFIQNLNNPWEYYYSKGNYEIFPYTPLMLYILSLFFGIYEFININSSFLLNFIFKLPTVLSDLLIFYILVKLFNKYKKEIAIFYFASPIVLYSAYMHSQLDLIPTALLFCSVYFIIRKKIIPASIIFGLAVGTKYHVIIAFPVIFIFLLRNYKTKDIINFVVLSVIVVISIISPFITSLGFHKLVFINPKGALLYDSFIHIGELKLYLPIFLFGIVILRYFAYSKVNTDLFIAYLTLIFAILIFTIQPSPGWYLWIVPYLSIFLIKYHEKIRQSYLLYTFMCISFLSYFVFFFLSDYNDLIFINDPINVKIENSIIKNLSFTCLEILLFAIIYSIFKIAVKSNLVYKSKNAFVIGIAGDSSSGKTTLVNDLKEMFKCRLVQIEGDGDHKWERGNENWQSYTHLNPSANFLYRQAENILSIKSGQNILRVDYDHSTGKFTDKQIVKANEYVVISGLHTLYLPIMRKAVDLKIYLDPDSKLNTHWKILRDNFERGYDKETVIKQITKRELESKKYIMPQKEFADLCINYYPNNEFEVGNSNSNYSLTLKLIFDSSFNIEPILLKLREKSIKYIHDYSEDLKNQFLIIEQEPDVETIESCSNTVVENIEELIPESSWLDGYRGFIQMIIIMLISSKLKGDYDD